MALVLLPVPVIPDRPGIQTCDATYRLTFQSTRRFRLQ